MSCAILLLGMTESRGVRRVGQETLRLRRRKAQGGGVLIIGGLSRK